MHPAIGLQLFSVKNSLEKDFVSTLENVAEIGYQNLELFSRATAEGLVFSQGMRAVELRKNMDSSGLRAVSCHFMPTAEMRLEAVLDDLKTLGVNTLVCAIAFFADDQDVYRFNQTFNQYGEICKKHGVQLYYHNHYHEFQVFGKKSIFEMMVEQMEEDLIKFELDTYWTARGGQDPIYWLKKLGSRCDLLHLKDIPAGTTPVNLFERIGYDGVINMDTIGATLDSGQFTEVGEGKLNIPGFIQASRTYNQARYLFVEQDMTRKSELESITASYTNLTRLLSAE